jgi:2-dehydro-3-deoxyphosphogalactonate aldolase
MNGDALHQAFGDALRATRAMAVLRPLPPARAVEVGEALFRAGFRLIEVPLNGEGALESLRLLTRAFDGRALIGAGTVLTPDAVIEVQAVGVRFIVAPNMDREVIQITRRLGLVSVPGVATPTEAFRALKYGASALKAFPGASLSPEAIAMWRTVLPCETLLLLFGGMNATNAPAYRRVGADGFGVAGAIYKPTYTVDEIETRAVAFLRAAAGGPDADGA